MLGRHPWVRESPWGAEAQMQGGPGHRELRGPSQGRQASTAPAVTCSYADRCPEEVSGLDPQRPLSRGGNLQASLSQEPPLSVPWDCRSPLPPIYSCPVC